MSDLSLYLPEVSSSQLQQLDCKLHKESNVNSVDSLWQAFGCDWNDGVSTAAITAAIDGLDPEYHWLRADPVALQIDLVHVYMLSNGQLKLQQHEIDSLRDNINVHLQEYNLELLTPHPQRWYIRVPNPVQLKTFDHAGLLGRSIRDRMPADPHYLNIFTELQMLLHQSAINQQRIAVGKQAVDALWLWGGGQKLQFNKASQWTSVISDIVYAQGLGQITHTPFIALETDSAKLIQSFVQDEGLYLIATEQFVLIDPSSDNFTRELLRFWRPIYNAWHAKKIATMTLYLEDGVFSLVRFEHIFKKMLKRMTQFLG